MKKIKLYIVISVVIGIILSVTLSFCLAETLIESKNVTYVDNSNLKANNVQTAIDGTCTRFSNELANLEKTLLDKFYPVGSIYISTSLSTVQQVNNTIGGEWEVYGKGQTLVGIDTNQEEFKTINQIGGEKTHTLTVEEMPSHTHIQNQHTHILPYMSNYGKGFNGYGFESGGSNITNGNGISVSFATATNQNTGGSKEHNNLQPYIVVYMYKRTK